MHRSFSPARFYVTALNVLLKQRYIAPACLQSCCRQHFATQTCIKNEVQNVAVLGGGITGLACAYYLSQHLPNTKITLLEGTSRLGGWLNSETIHVGNGKIIFEQGPRSLRPGFPNGAVTLDLVSSVG